MKNLIAVNTKEDILPEYRDTPIGLLFEYHNLNRPYDNYEAAQLLMGMCMDNRKKLQIPGNFSFIIRTGGANLRYSEFHTSFAIGVGGVKHIALIGHSNCGMVNVSSRKQDFISGMVEHAGWEENKASEFFINSVSLFEINNSADFVLSETKRLRQQYPKIIVAPLYYMVEDCRLYFIDEKE